MAKIQKAWVELGFRTNAQEAKKQINDLAINLKKLSNMEIGLKGGDLDAARAAARDLTIELQKAVNLDTGRINLSKLTKNLKAGNKDLTTLSGNLLKAGHVGQESFLQIARAVSSAEVPMIQINKTVKDFMENLGKTAKWQIATNAWQTIQSTIQNSFREAENLNRALNDIRIVTGLDKTAMAQFAKEANKAAKELKTTTKEYAEASLIFYQQGLNAAEVAKRAEVVIKMSQVTGDAASAASDQMTAIWNNFADGTKTLEYYADAMAKLGAETAASTSEIANGLEKFAAIAETVGLSYETAMASVATVIDKTRQSADVVGTAFKTIFARVQGLQLDGVTDDGVTLNKYSAALERVGVDVLTASGELKDMDDILAELGEKWKLLGREQQVAVAQVVGGARQYNQLLSLMDNWADVQSNIVKAQSSTGEISKQANIWADSYEAAAKRVEEAKARASENFLNSEDVVSLTNAFADLIEFTDSFIDSMGGIVPLGLTIVGLFSKKLIPIAKTGFTSLKDNLFTFFGGSEKILNKTQTDIANYLKELEGKGITDSLAKQYEWSRKLILVKQEMAETTKYMSAQERESALAVLDIYEHSVEAAIEANDRLNQAEKKLQNNKIQKVNEIKTAVIKQNEKNFFESQDIEDPIEQEKIKKMARKGGFSEASVAKDKATLAELEEAKKSRDWYQRELQRLNQEYQKESSIDTSTLTKTQKRDHEEGLKRIQYAQANRSEMYQALKGKVTALEQTGVSAETIDMQEKALAYQSMTQKQPKVKKDLLTQSFGSIDIDSNFSFGEIGDVNILKEYKKIADGIFDKTKIGDYNVEFTKHNGQLDISINNYEALAKQTANYQAQLLRLTNVSEELKNSDLEEVAKAENDYEAAKTEASKAKNATKKKGGNTPENLAKLAKAEEEVLKKEQALEAIRKKNEKSLNNATKLIKGNKQQFLELAKNAGYSEKELDQFNKELDEINPQDAKSLQAVQQHILALKQTVDLTTQSLDNMSNEVKEGLIEAFGEDYISQKTKDLEEFKQAYLEATQKNDEALLSEDDLGNTLDGISTKFEDIVGGVASASAAIAGLHGGITTLFNAFEEGNSPLETFLGILGAVTAMAPAVGAAIKFVSAAKSLAAKQAVADNAKEQVSDKATFIGKLMGYLATGTASLNPVMVAGAVAGLALLGVAGMSIATNVSKKQDEHQRAENDANIELANQSNDLAKAVSIESQEIDELVSQYNKLNAEKADTTEITKDIIEQTNAVIEKYQEYADTIKLTAENASELKNALKDLQNAQALGDIEGIKSAQEAADYAIAKNAEEINKTGMQGILSNIGLKEDAKQVRTREGYIVRKVGGVNGGGGTEETQANSILRKYMQYTRSTANNTNIKLRTDTPENFVEDYENLQKAVDEMYASKDERVRDASTNDTLRECQELLSTYQAEYESLKASIASGDSLTVQKAVGAAAGQGYSVSNITDYESYTAYKKAVGENLTKDQQTALDSWLSTNGETSQYVDVEKRIDALADKTAFAKGEYEELLKTISAEAFLQVNANIYVKPEDIKEEALRIENELRRKDIGIQLDAYSNIKDKLKPEGMTSEDWQSIADSDIFKDDPAAFRAFMNKSYGEQLVEISEKEKALSNESEALLRANIDSYRETLNNSTSSTAAKAEAKARIEELQAELAILVKVKGEQEKYLKSLRMSDIADIYHGINQELAKLQRNYNKLAQAQSDAYGKDTLKYYNELASNLEEQNVQLERGLRLRQSEANVKQEQLRQDTKDALGVDLLFDKDGNIMNYETVLKAFDNLKKGGADITELWDQWQEQYGEYTSDVDQILKDTETIEDKARKIASLKFDRIVAKVDLQIEIKDITLQKLNYDINRALSSVTTSNEALSGYGEQAKLISDSLSSLTGAKLSLDTAFAETGNAAEYADGLKKVYSETFNNLSALDELEDTIINYYGNVLAKAQEEIGKYTDQMQHLNSVLEHYKTLMDLIGESTSAGMKAILHTQTVTAKNSYEVSSKLSADLAQNLADAETKLADHIAAQGDKLDKDNDATYKALVKNVETARKAAQDAQNQSLSDATAWAQAMRDEVEFQMNEIYKSMEKAFTGGSTFDEITTNMQRKSTLQSEFLTTTNKIYETNKLIRDVEMQTLKINNSAVKQRLKAFADETKSLQNKSKLSNVELGIQQKKYDLLLAEIALQDAQNAKSTVRLTRTAEGGFGYIYTADENAVAEAEQNYADAENALYNTRLEAANSYTEKSIQTQQEFFNAMQELSQRYYNGEIESEAEYQRLRDELVAYYTELLQGYSDIYSVTVVDDANVARDAWSSSFSGMVTDMTTWKDKVEEYSGKLDDTISDWKDWLKIFKETVGLDFAEVDKAADGTSSKVGGLATTLDGITTSSGALRDALLGKEGEKGVIDAMDDLVDAGADWLTSTGAKWVSKIGKVRKSFSDLKDEIYGAIEALGKFNKLNMPEPSQSPAGEGENGTIDEGYHEFWETFYNENMSGNKRSWDSVEKELKAEGWSDSYITGAKNAYDDATGLSEGHKQAQENYGDTYADEVKAGIEDSKNMALTALSNGSRTANSYVFNPQMLAAGEGTPGNDEGTEDTEPEGKQEAVAMLTSIKMGQPYGAGQTGLVEKAAEYFSATGGITKQQATYALWALNSSGYTTKVNGDNGVLNDVWKNMVINEDTIKQIKQDLLNPNNKSVLEFLDDGVSSRTGTWMWYNARGVANTTSLTGESLFKKGSTLNLASLSDGVEQVVAKVNNAVYRMPLDKFYEAYLPGFKTGGYTGAWGPEGKMAMLHEKEIVLNKEDTVNLLDSIKLLRSILGTIDLQAANAQLSSLSPGALNNANTSTETLEQNVHIEARFDNVSDKNEIVEAFNTLINQASQYANRKH